MRLMLTLQALCTFDLDQLQKAFDQSVTFDDSDPVTAATETSGVVTLASLATQQFAFPAGFTAASFMMIVANQKIQVQLNSNSAPLVDVDPVPAVLPADVLSSFQRQSQPGLVIWRGKITSLYLTNPGTAPASAFVALVGNAS